MTTEFYNNIRDAYLVALELWPDCNPFQPGFIRESIMADSLNHTLILKKKGKDARDEEGVPVEYKTWKSPYRSKLNAQSSTGLEPHFDPKCEMWYFGKFEPPFKLVGLWSIPSPLVKKKCEDFMQRNPKEGHITIDFSEKWVKDVGVELEVGKDMQNRFVIALSAAVEIADSAYGVKDITLKGRVREILIAEILNHVIIIESMQPDAKDSEGHLYEYLSSLEGKFQMTHMTEAGCENKVLRNKAIFCAQFSDPVTISEIWEVDPKVYMKKMEGRRPWKKDIQNNFTVTLDWVKSNGNKVYPK